jgi:hypothetical protein
MAVPRKAGAGKEVLAVVAQSRVTAQLPELVLVALPDERVESNE